MQKICLYLGALSCLFMGCLPEEAFNDEVETQSICQTKSALNTPTVENAEFKLYYDIPRENKIFYQAGVKLFIAEGKDNHCVDFLTEEPIDTDSCGIARLKMQAKSFDCEDGVRVKVCDAQDNTICVEFTVFTTADENDIDKNHNLMIDEYETNSDKDKYTEEGYESGNCSSFCHSDADCEDFCDSAIEYRCSTRCTSDDQCIKYKVNDTDDNWTQMKCRDDGRCAYPSFKVKYGVVSDEVKVTMGGYPAEENVTIDWGDGTVETIPMSTNNDLSHTYAKGGKDVTYTVEITGDYRGWTAGCSLDGAFGIRDVSQFGPIGFGYIEEKDQGAFTNCNLFNEISAKDIPDSTKLTNMNAMFARTEGRNGDTENTQMRFNHKSVTRWDTSNVTSMEKTFCNAGYYHTSKYFGFNQDIGRWNTSKVKTMKEMFNTATYFNQDISCWDVSQVKNISSMFSFNEVFSQNLENWNLEKVFSFDDVFEAPSGKMKKNGKYFGFGLTSYCTLMKAMHNENIGLNTIKCWGDGVSYSVACKDNAWKKKFESCKEDLTARFSDITVDNVTCNDLMYYCK